MPSDTSPAHHISSEKSSEFTPRAVLTGLAIGCLLCFTNLYFGLQSGWISMMSLQSTLIGYLVSRLFKEPITPQENVILQTTAVATGTMPLAAGFVGIIPALGLLNPENDGVSAIDLDWLNGIIWSIAIAFFGVFLAAPIRKQVIIKEQLPFPSGTATAQLITVLHEIPPIDPGVHRRTGYQTLDDQQYPQPDTPGTAVTESSRLESLEDEQTKSKGGWNALVWSFVASGAMTIAAYFFPVLFALPVFGSYLAREWAWWFTPSLSYIGQGIIMGFPTTLSMNAGMFCGWAILSPLSKNNGWAPGPVNSMTDGARGWILWTALAIMVVDSLVSLAPVVIEFIQVNLFDKRHSNDIDDEVETHDRLVPTKWVYWGVIGTITIGTILVWIVFGNEGIKPWATIVGFFIGGFLSILGVRALGETDLNPVSGLGKISQFVFAFIQPGNVVANLVAGGVAEAGAQQAGDLMQDLKTGHLIRASPRAQFYGQLIGSALSVIVTTTAYKLYTQAYSIPGIEFPAPTAYVWLSLARLLRDGSLPSHSQEFVIGSALLFGAISCLKIRASRDGRSWAKWIPSGVAFAIGFLNTPSFSLARLIGGIAEYLFRRKMIHKDAHQDIRLVIVASGFVLGEGVMSIVSLVLKTLGVGPLSCIGCGGGICAGCSG